MKKNSISYLKFFLVFSFVFSLFISGYAQPEYFPEEKKVEGSVSEEIGSNEMDLEKHIISYYGENFLFLEKGDFAYNFGTRLDLQAGIFGFYYKLGLGVNPSGKLYGHIPLGLEAGGVLLVLAFTGNDSYYLILPAVLCAIVPEGVTARVWTKKNFNLKLYLSPWGSELNFSKEHFTLVSGEFGLQANIINKHRFNLSCYAGTKVIYKQFQPVAAIGATVGILID